MVHVAHFEPGPFAGEAAGAEGREAALMGQLGQGVGLVHELGELRTAEELLDGRHHRPDVDQRLGRDDVHILDGHAFLDHPLHPGKADAELVLQEFADGLQAAVAQMVDVVHVALSLEQADQVTDHADDVFPRQRLDGLDPFNFLFKRPRHVRWSFWFSARRPPVDCRPR